jgi:hypothetical protein
VLGEESAYNLGLVYRRVILHEQRRTAPMRHESFCQGLHIALARVALFFGLWIAIDDEVSSVQSNAASIPRAGRTYVRQTTTVQ